MGAKCVILFGFVFLSVNCWAGLTEEPWPKRIKEFSLEEDTAIVGAHEISFKEAENQTAGGSGGRIYDTAIKNLKTDETLNLQEQSVGLSILEDYQGWPQLEIWGRGGGGFYSRSLYRSGGHGYQYVHTDEFTVTESRATNTSITAMLPFRDEVPYFVETRVSPRH